MAVFVSGLIQLPHAAHFTVTFKVIVEFWWCNEGKSLECTSHCLSSLHTAECEHFFWHELDLGGSLLPLQQSHRWEDFISALLFFTTLLHCSVLWGTSTARSTFDRMICPHWNRSEFVATLCFHCVFHDCFFSPRSHHLFVVGCWLFVDFFPTNFCRFTSPSIWVQNISVPSVCRQH